MFEFGMRYPIPFLISLVCALLLGFLLSEQEEGPKKAGFTILIAYFILIIGWFIASKIWKL